VKTQPCEKSKESMQVVYLVQIMHIPIGNASISLGVLGSFVFRLWMGDHWD